MDHYDFSFCGEALQALRSGALYLPAKKMLCVSDLHFGKAQRYALHGGAALPPYETQDTLGKLEQDICATQPQTIVCLGDSFDRMGASEDMVPQTKEFLLRLQEKRRWIWIEGNHDPSPLGMGGENLAEFELDRLVFRHIAQSNHSGEISGHYHPKITLRLRARSITRRCFITDANRIIMPAYGTYTGGLSVRSDPLKSYFDSSAICILTGETMHTVPMPR